MKAPPEIVFRHINDLRAWTPWSPYEKRDLAMKKTYTGAATGTGAVYEWSGNSQVGAGRVTITDSTPPERIGIKLEMFKPFAATNDVVFTLRPLGSVTEVTWAMDGRNTFLSKVMSVFFDMDKMVGGDFESGLSSLKALVEKQG
jgi:hypothetical protein